MKIIVPMAGRGQRFAKLGYEKPKPLIPVSIFGNMPMIEAVVNNIRFDAEYIFIVQAEHCKKYNLDVLLESICPNCKIVLTDGVTEGAACTALLAKDHIDCDEPILIVNSDQHVQWNKEEFIKNISRGYDGCIFTFKTNNPNCSYVKLDVNGFVTEAVEKKAISDTGTVGIYYWNKGSDFVKYANQMIIKNIRTNNEFYICPVYQEAVNDGKKVTSFDVIKYWSLGTPEDLTNFVDNYNKS
jgi:dTDP-glucose pyrophosphorylase